MNRVWLLVILSMLVCGTAQAHRLTVNWEVRDGALIIEGKAGGSAAAGADVELRSASGAVLEVGVLDQNGLYKWPLQEGGDLTVVVNAGPGHRRSLTVKKSHLHPPASAPGSGLQPGSDQPEREWHAHGSSDDAVSIGLKVVIGLTFLLAAAAAWMSYRNMVRLSKMEQLWREHEGRG
jgi:nickel transport protein